MNVLAQDCPACGEPGGGRIAAGGAQGGRGRAAGCATCGAPGAAQGAPVAGPGEARGGCPDVADVLALAIAVVDELAACDLLTDGGGFALPLAEGAVRELQVFRMCQQLEGVRLGLLARVADSGQWQVDCEWHDYCSLTGVALF